MARATITRAASAGGTRADDGAEHRSRVLERFRRNDRFFHHLTCGAMLVVPALLLAIVASLVYGAWPALSRFGLDFLIAPPWEAGAERISALAAVRGTLVTSLIALLIAVPVGLAIAVFVTELCPGFLRRPVGVAVELLAGIPSIVYGIWGLFFLAPLLERTLHSFLPGLDAVFGGPPLGLGTLTAGLILAVMVLPFIASVSRDVFDTVPAMTKEAAYGLGCTTWEVVRDIVIPHNRAALLGGVMLALARALGETMAVVFVIDSARRMAAPLVQPGTTLAATIALEYADASAGLYRSSLVALGLILFIVSFVVLAAARLMLARLNRQGSQR